VRLLAAECVNAAPAQGANLGGSVRRFLASSAPVNVCGVQPHGGEPPPAVRHPHVRVTVAPAERLGLEMFSAVVGSGVRGVVVRWFAG
jgi:hypothetical protein